GVSGVVIRGVVGPYFWQPLTVMIVAGCFLIGLFFALSVALIKPAVSNRALPVRLFITAAWLVTGVAAAISGVIERTYLTLALWLSVFEIVFAVAIFVAVSERDELGRRVLRSVPRSWLGRSLAFFFFSGAANGVAWASTFVVLTLAADWAFAKS